MKKRKQFINWLFVHSQRIYLRFKNKQPWNLTTERLLEFPKDSLGNALGNFLSVNGFQLIPKVERHDAYHLLTGFSTSVEDEIALQYCCFGNGKRTPYLIGVLLLGTLLLPEYFSYYKKAFKLGKQSNSFHHFDFKKVLLLNYQQFRARLFSEEIEKKLNMIQTFYSNKQFNTSFI